MNVLVMGVSQSADDLVAVVDDLQHTDRRGLRQYRGIGFRRLSLQWLRRWHYKEADPRLLVAHHCAIPRVVVVVVVVNRS